MAQAQGVFTPDSNTAESEPFGFDFTKDLPAGDRVTGIASVFFTQVGGTAIDPNVASRMVGSAYVNGNIASQRLVNLVPNCIYKLLIYVSTLNGNVLDLWSYVNCVEN